MFSKSKISSSFCFSDHQILFSKYVLRLCNFFCSGRYQISSLSQSVKIIPLVPRFTRKVQHELMKVLLNFFFLFSGSLFSCSPFWHWIILIQLVLNWNWWWKTKLLPTTKSSIVNYTGKQTANDSASCYIYTINALIYHPISMNGH